jgi:hypothetical protein
MEILAILIVLLVELLRIDYGGARRFTVVSPPLVIAIIRRIILSNQAV